MEKACKQFINFLGHKELFGVVAFVDSIDFFQTDDPLVVETQLLLDKLDSSDFVEDHLLVEFLPFDKIQGREVNQGD